MIRCTTFARSAGFAAGAAAGWLAWAVAAAPTLGIWRALSVYLVAITALYVAALTPGNARGSSARRRAAVLVATGALAALLAACAHNMTELTLGLAGVIGIGRSVFLYRAAPARAAAIEAALLGGGLLFARFLAAHTLGSIALALWGFLLVQSVFFLIAGVAPRASDALQPDPFATAHRRALALLKHGSR